MILFFYLYFTVLLVIFSLYALQVAELLGFRACIISCLDYLEAVPWVGEEEENVISSVRNLQSENYGVSPVLKRVASDLPVLVDLLTYVLRLFTNHVGTAWSPC